MITIIRQKLQDFSLRSKWLCFLWENGG